MKCHRVPLEVGCGPLLCRAERGCQALRLAAGKAVQPTSPLGCRGQLDVRGDLSHGEAQLLGAETRIEGRKEFVDLHIGCRSCCGICPADRQVDRRPVLNRFECSAQVPESEAQAVRSRTRGL